MSSLVAAFSLSLLEEPSLGCLTEAMSARADIGRVRHDDELQVLELNATKRGLVTQAEIEPVRRGHQTAKVKTKPWGMVQRMMMQRCKQARPGQRQHVEAELHTGYVTPTKQKQH